MYRREGTLGDEISLWGLGAVATAFFVNEMWLYQDGLSRGVEAR